MTHPGRTLRRALTRGLVVAPGAYDALSARLAAQAGHRAVYMTGFGVAGSLLGVPDLGIVSATEMADRVAALRAAAHPVPLIADGDTGHGGVLNVQRTVRLYAQAGAAAIQIEDQVFPKRCGHMAGKAVVDLPEAVARIRAAVAARPSPDLLIIARTDARAISGLAAALERGRAFLAAGADVLFIEAPQSLADMHRITAAFPGVPLVANMVEDGRTPMLAADALADLGFRLVLFPVSALLAAAATLAGAYAGLREIGRLPPETPRLSFQDYNSRLGLETLLAAAEAARAHPPASARSGKGRGRGRAQ